jgi:hypothetical protein
MKIIKVWIIAVLGLLLYGPLFGQITLKAFDEYGNSSNTFNVGVPWTLQVSLQDMPDVKGRPTIQGLDRIYTRDSSVMTTSINGKVTIQYTYRVRFDAAGAYTVGPATIEKDGKIYTSNTLTIKITDQPIDTNQVKDTNKSSALFVVMKTDKNRVVVGEKFTCTLRCYYTDQVNQVAPSPTMQLEGFVFQDGVQQVDGIENIKGVNYKYFQLSWSVYATEPGKKNIPAYSIDYMVNSNQYMHPASAIAMMFGHAFSERKRAYSNIVPITIDPLPPHDSPVHAIGTFSSFVAKIDPAVARQGEGMVFTLELTGQGAFDKNHGIELHDIPSPFKYYDSKQYDDGPKKCFEFIVQGLSVGQWQLPSQQFTFFDTKTRSYKTLETQAVSVKIIPNAAQKHTLSEAQLSQQLPEAQQDLPDDIKPFLLQEDKTKDPLPVLPLWLMVGLVISAAMFFFYKDINERIPLFNLVHRKSVQRKSFARARAQIKTIFAQQRFSLLYPTFVQLFATRCSVDVHEVNQEFIYTVLKKSGLHAHELEQWNQFYNQLNELMFSNKQVDHKEYQVLQHYADRWIDRLEKII